MVIWKHPLTLLRPKISLKWKILNYKKGGKCIRAGKEIFMYNLFYTYEKTYFILYLEKDFENTPRC